MKKITTRRICRTSRLQDGQLTIGLDVGDRSSFYCAIDGKGEVILEAKVATRPEALKETFGRMPRSRIALETGTHSPGSAVCSRNWDMRRSWLMRATFV